MGDSMVMASAAEVIGAGVESGTGGTLVKYSDSGVSSSAAACYVSAEV